MFFWSELKGHTQELTSAIGLGRAGDSSKPVSGHFVRGVEPKQSLRHSFLRFAV